jgi:acylphosphatase
MIAEGGERAERLRRRVIVHGRVQGVSFRASTREAARRAGAQGWVRNLADGGVEAVFEGDPAAVATLLAFCREGPTWAEVDDVEVFAEPPQGVSGFEIRRS